jgi:hypothetical protein
VTITRAKGPKVGRFATLQEAQKSEDSDWSSSFRIHTKNAKRSEDKAWSGSFPLPYNKAKRLKHKVTPKESKAMRRQSLEFGAGRS